MTAAKRRKHDPRGCFWVWAWLVAALPLVWYQQKDLDEAVKGWRRSNDIAKACLTIINKSILPKGKRVPRS